ncbi:MAG: 50S ribosomal protein L11 methyltransferase [Salibacteraceae bacterium]
MNYLEVKFAYNPEKVNGEILLAEVAEIPFESFVEEEGLLTAYVQVDEFDKSKLDEIEFLTDNEIIPGIQEIQQVNWNEEWEKNFDLVEVANNCVIIADFHKLDREYKYTIRINPKMSFGTGHHATTSLVLGHMLKMDFKSKTILDMGTGTGVLAILAAMMGATHTLAIDNNIWAYENSIENVRLNGWEKEIEVVEGEVDLIEGRIFDSVLANINKNVIKAQLANYYTALKPGGDLLLSGILTSDSEEIKERAIGTGFNFVTEQQKDKWTLLVFSK